MLGLEGREVIFIVIIIINIITTATIVIKSYGSWPSVSHPWAQGLYSHPLDQHKTQV